MPGILKIILLHFQCCVLQLYDTLFILARHHWRTPDTTAEGQKPEARMGHTAVYDPTVCCIYVFGGSKQKRWFNDVHILDVDNWKWQAVKVGTSELLGF